MEKPRVGILTTFYSWDTSYSLVSVVEAQLVSLLDNGYAPVLFVHDNFTDDGKLPVGVEVRKVVPRFLLKDYSGHEEVGPSLSGQADMVLEALKQNASDIDVFFEHDLIFQGWFLPYAIAIHEFAKVSKVKWFHWIHSVTSPRPNVKYPHSLRYTLPANSKLVYLNNYHVVRTAESYDTFPTNVRVVHNPIDPRLFWHTSELTTQLIRKYGLLDADFIQTYPLSTPRMMGGKGLGTVIEIFGKLKASGFSVRLVVCNAHANADKEKELIRETQKFAAERGLSSAEVIFTSLEGKEYELGVGREVVSELFHLSNLFVFPSLSENCSLILLEAMLAKNLLVLNDSVPSMREFGGANAIYFNFGSIDQNVVYNDREKFMEDVAKIIVAEFNQNKSLKAAKVARQKFNLDYIFKRQIEPLLYE